MDIHNTEQDLCTPPATDGAPSAGRRVPQVLARYAGTAIHHLLYLPTDWEPDKTYPVIVEYPGNGGYRNDFGDTCDGTVDGCNLGYGIGGGTGVIWICMPCVDVEQGTNATQWWGDVTATVDYCKMTVEEVCLDYGGDASNVFITGFSRGSIACNYIGLHDDAIASLWRGFICHSHYDGVVPWNYDGSDRESAAVRLARLGGRPQFISHEKSIDETKMYLAEACPDGRFTFLPLPYHNHTDTWVLRDIPERQAVRDWFFDSMSDE